MILDTCFLIDLLKNDEDANKKMEELEDSNSAYSVSAPSVYELWVGVARSDASEQEKDQIIDIISSSPCHSLDKKAGEAAGKIQAKLSQDGAKIGHMDALISGIAISKDRSVLTRNLEEFKKVDDLRAESY